MKNNLKILKKYYSIVTMLWVFFYCTDVIAQDEYIIAVNEAYSFNNGASNIRNLFNQVYAPLGIKPVVEFYPSLRGLKLVNEGLLDAESGRTIEIASQYTNLIKVSFPIMLHKNGYFCTTVEACETSEETRYAVVAGFETGKQFCKDNKFNCLLDQSHGMLAKALESGTIDVLIASYNTATKALCAMKNKPIYYKNLMELSVTSYHLIHKKHQDLEPALAASIQNLARQGEVTRLLHNASVENTECLVEVIELVERI